MSALLALLTLPASAANFADRTSDDSPIEPSADEAVLVFFRPSKYGGNKPAVVDGNGTIVAQMVGKSHFVHRVAPGEHTFTVWGEATPTLKATVEAGEIYYVKMDSSMGAWTARFPMVAMGPSREGWEQVAVWLERTQRWTLNEAKATAYAEQRAGDLQVVLAKGERVWSEYDDQRRTNRSLTKDDGITEALR
ncbi:MAG: DUF2846 domain-containing protein [Myxococcales bacterium]|nr:DUF2846 domain-containing protein [Myxococcales bacterium]